MALFLMILIMLLLKMADIEIDDLSAREVGDDVSSVGSDHNSIT